MHIYIARSGDVALAAGVAKTILSLITPATRRARPLELKIGLKGVTPTHAPGLVELVQFDTDGTGTSTTPRAVDPADPAALCTAKSNYTVEPTTNVVVLDSFPLTPVGGLVILQIPFGEQHTLLVSKVLGVRMTYAEIQTAHASLKFQE